MTHRTYRKDIPIRSDFWMINDVKKIKQMKNSFNEQDTAEFISRIDKLTPTTKPIWGKMDVAKMMAH